jgi:hypothetical protein
MRVPEPPTEARPTRKESNERRLDSAHLSRPDAYRAPRRVGVEVGEEETGGPREEEEIEGRSERERWEKGLFM